MNILRTIGVIASVAVISGCEVAQDASNSPTAPRAAPQSVAAPVTQGQAEIANRARSVAAMFQSQVGRDLGGGWNFDRASANGDRVVVEMQVPESGRLYRNVDRPDDPLRRGINRNLCQSAQFAQFLASGGEVQFIVEGVDNVRIGSFLFTQPCRT